MIGQRLYYTNSSSSLYGGGGSNSLLRRCLYSSIHGWRSRTTAVSSSATTFRRLHQHYPQQLLLQQLLLQKSVCVTLQRQQQLVLLRNHSSSTAAASAYFTKSSNKTKKSSKFSWKSFGYYMGMGLIIPSIPIGTWWYQAYKHRQERIEEVASKVRFDRRIATSINPTLDELMVEKCLPGDVVLFDRRCESCAAGPLAALSCYVSQYLLCQEQDRRRRIDYGKFNHCGIIVPGPATTVAERLDPTNLSVLEATASGIVVRPLIQRMEMTQSRCMIVLPLSPPGEQRSQHQQQVEAITTATTTTTRGRQQPPPPRGRQGRNNKRSANSATTTTTISSSHQASVQMAREFLNTVLAEARDQFPLQSKQAHYEYHDSFLGIFGALAYTMGLTISSSYYSSNPSSSTNDGQVNRASRSNQLSWLTYPNPISPSAFLVVQLLQRGGAAENNVYAFQAYHAKVEDFLRDWKPTTSTSNNNMMLDDEEEDIIRLRPGWKFLPPMILRAPAAFTTSNRG